MQKLLICYDLYKQGQNYKAIDNLVPTLGDCRKILNTTWILKTKYSYNEVFDKLQKECLDCNDKCLVFELPYELNGISNLSKDVTEWINS
ncbi:hypothetical protein CPIN18021_0346 [Campylobacter pinnipediorum subsp. caledonicus]|uniref:Uncharacterized protein n=1 Tax=Campylobacter pinnipediorum subsp. caledonicus TaxID=1874362 RepID=A0A1S6U677_9BACT|nr:hypothetical protein [Campylobacter pinnipediorum]AQW85586.1 hypothetical protein CPIN18020_0345 [Campylobacter pinnipediorum subsp. caledonicus]AQW87192.1 hypothetical protein CPIN18021_0346 [Campylobacter pinnipediorum subsp. caledonicus]OPA71866.1 hypothetical protein BB381_06945 [Campylobacter pinnipediorum subsp. caledonicus]